MFDGGSTEVPGIGAAATLDCSGAACGAETLGCGGFFSSGLRQLNSYSARVSRHACWLPAPT